ncbi:MAG: hypothetical protein COA96_16690 [SAR86 cluster bacterium]|uniref:Methyltransferase n=1 Tax=SAR86 cluster bacterium TaxID=2030880 RepID=A0A2A5AFZ8_9GAMM|nr:MAG: hypothetical protein COA96_16690 [SAR86 cluster bacterium]
MTHATKIPSMLPDSIQAYMTELAAKWTGQGSVVECGAWLGATTAALCDGLVSAGYDRKIHVYDRWEANGAECGKAGRQGVPIEDGQNTLGVLMELLGDHARMVSPHRGRIERAQWSAVEPIELFVLDACKYEAVFMPTIMTFAKAWIPGVTTVAFMDHHFYQRYDVGSAEHDRYSIHARWLEAHAESFSVVRDFAPDEPMILRYVKPIDWGVTV